MIQKELYRTRSDGVKLFHIYSDDNKDLLQVETGYFYNDVIDIENAGYTYQEIDREETGADEVEDMREVLGVLG